MTRAQLANICTILLYTRLRLSQSTAQKPQRGVLRSFNECAQLARSVQICAHILIASCTANKVKKSHPTIMISEAVYYSNVLYVSIHKPSNIARNRVRHTISRGTTTTPNTNTMRWFTPQHYACICFCGCPQTHTEYPGANQTGHISLSVWRPGQVFQTRHRVYHRNSI